MSSVALRLSTRSSLFSATDPSFSLPPSSRSSSSGSVSRVGSGDPPFSLPLSSRSSSSGSVSRVGSGDPPFSLPLSSRSSSSGSVSRVAQRLLPFPLPSAPFPPSPPPRFPLPLSPFPAPPYPLPFRPSPFSLSPSPSPLSPFPFPPFRFLSPSPAPSSSPPARCPPPFLSCLPVSFLRAASTVGAAAAASKVLGLMREMVLAAAFGVGPVMTAFSYASLIPTFCLSLLGGVNGPFHSAIASVLSKAAEKDTGKDTEKGGGRSSQNAARMQQELLVLVSVLVALLQQMAPTIALAPLIGIGFGTLSARGEFAIPSLSPSLSSLSVLLGIAVYFALCRWSPIASPQREIIGGTCLAVSFTAGALLQWLIQVLSLTFRCSLLLSGAL
ncbi:unnamed protein product [Closterium sp. Naga37s-1]|nr:unnamed protein product [Closterium sp. Naga37s-1]